MEWCPVPAARCRDLTRETAFSPAFQQGGGYVAQLAEHRAFNLMAAGSSPAIPNSNNLLLLGAGRMTLNMFQQLSPFSWGQ